MIKKPTLILLICAAIAVGAVYFFNWRASKHPAAATETHTAFESLVSADVTSITLDHPGASDEKPVRLQKSGDAWRIAQPIETGADQTAAGAIADDLADATVSQTEPATPDRLKAFGLDPPRLTLDFQTKAGAKHTVAFGNQDFSGASVYARVDGAQTVDLLPNSLLSSADKPLNDLRDRQVLHLNSSDVKSFDIRRATGELAAAKQADNWQITKPAAGPADQDAVGDLLGAVSGARMSSVVSETPDDLAKYGLAHPAITFAATDTRNKLLTLEIGSKHGDDYYARDASRPTIFLVRSDLEKKLAEKYTDLRDKKIAELDSANVSRIQMRDSSGSMVLTQSADQWTFDAPASQKGKQAETWRIFSGISDARAVDILDRPSPKIARDLAKPAVEITFTDKNGAKQSLDFSAADGDSVYARSSARSSIYKFSKDVLSSLDLKPSDLAF